MAIFSGGFRAAKRRDILLVSLRYLVYLTTISDLKLARFLAVVFRVSNMELCC